MDTNSAEEQPLIQHLLELRSRLLKSLLCVVITFAALFVFANDIYEFVAHPLQQFLPENSTMIATDVASPFLTPFKLTLLVSMFLSMPYILFQIWSFIAPALYQNEKRLALPLFVSSVILFYCGIAFAYYVVFPLAFQFFMSVAPDSVAAMPDMSSYLNFVLKIIFGFGVAFEVPVVTVMLIAAGVTTTESLATKRPYVIVGCFVLGMFLTPPDVISQVLLALPMWLLFELGLFFGNFIVKKTPSEQQDAL
ncbi:twin-arginine translocase subunit TatC [Agarilytica rhodophyticola]|uniref:twin-arginine translocase subunit TatC n=1 Tax=Agarilytica rhodophyticola TaxID=1737490 RepID=UPI000B343E3F|nr:twin-arginine translocase subunit TatC [Agarilytica rhodophyticola]